MAEDATANYVKTAFSLVSSLNMEELDFEALAGEAAAPDDCGDRCSAACNRVTRWSATSMGAAIATFTSEAGVVRAR